MTEPLIKVPDVQFERAKLMLARARWAASRMQKLDRTSLRRIIDAVAVAGHAKAQHYAEWAVRETGMGVVEHKRMKNEACSKGLVALYGNEDFISPKIDAAKKIGQEGDPEGVVPLIAVATKDESKDAPASDRKSKVAPEHDSHKE